MILGGIMNLETLTNYFFIFFIFSIAGWLIEVVLKFIDLGKFVNRGFLIGPYCPIYGLGAFLIVFAINGLIKYEHSYALVFLTSLIICGLVEYFVSYYLEKKYHARWWDYSSKPMNLNGRIWIGNLILFGIGGLLIVEVFSPFFLSLFYKMSLRSRTIFSIVVAIIMLSDYVVSYFVMKLIKVNIEKSKADNTEEIKKEIKILASNKNILYSRFVNAYPEVKFRTDRIKNRIKEIELETKKIKAELEFAIDEQKESLRTNLRPSTIIKSEIIESQEALISLLEDESSSKEEIENLRSEIKEKKDLLEKRKNLINVEKIEKLKLQ